ncbi:hypothetical protein D929_02694 [Enterococcus faecalis 02-MB-P-10]|uniref:hypothetical protein n=1 Tax=Enterococcus faecalis TaxID=1351 RepID=UPI000352B3AB|nr:hypothetical protein [Enterococcus faecalis]EPH68901.1 hypothetical protein D929_02694 [Enterococcus faecalis 02-MB-P-10]
MDAVEKLWKEYKKSLQKVKVLTLSMSLVREQRDQVRKAKKTGDEALKDAQKAIGQSSDGLEKSVKGQFGKKVTEVMEKQKKMLDSF